MNWFHENPGLTFLGFVLLCFLVSNVVANICRTIMAKQTPRSMLEPEEKDDA